MSEYQYVTFRALDGPLDEEALAYMGKQSSRAEYDEWSFSNEYHYSGFRGNTLEMLRRGYDMHFHYANFGIRRLMIRLPDGFPDPSSAKLYLDNESIRFHKDEKGKGGVLEIRPYIEGGELNDLWDIDSIFTKLLPLRSEILDGDLRPLYLAHLAVSMDANHEWEETCEGPVPAGMGSLTKAQIALADLYGIDEHLLAVIAEGGPSLPAGQDREAMYAKWLKQRSAKDKEAWLLELMLESEPRLRSKVLAEYREKQPGAGWPTVRCDRTIVELMGEAEMHREGASKKAKADAERQREKYLRDMAKDPESVLLKTEQLVENRSTKNYEEAAEILDDLRTALAGTDRADLADKQAWKLKKENPTLHHLTAALRRKGFVPK